MESSKTGTFITFEGPEGSGKSTQIRLLAERLEHQGVPVLTTREPGGTALGNSIRSLLLDTNQYEITGLAELFLLAAARAQHVTEVIQPALDAGKVVLCDRFVESSYAYQGGGRGIPMEQIRAVQNIAVNGAYPDLVVLLDVPVDIGLARRFSSEDEINRLDLADREFHEAVRATYLERVNSDWIVVNAVPSIEIVAQQVQSRILEYLQLTDHEQATEP